MNKEKLPEIFNIVIHISFIYIIVCFFTLINYYNILFSIAAYFMLEEMRGLLISLFFNFRGNK